MAGKKRSGEEGGMRMEVIETMRFADFEVSERAEYRVWRCKRATGEKNCQQRRPCGSKQRMDVY